MDAVDTGAGEGGGPLGSMRRRLGRPVVLAAAVLAAAAAAVLLMGSGGGSDGQAAVGGLFYPETLPGGYSVEKVVSGDEALAMVKGIHWEPGMVRAERALIVVYSDGTRLWIVDTGGDACGLVARMAEKMRMYQDRLPYTAPVEHSIGGTTVYMSLDKRDGRLHVFWCSGSLAVWAELGASAYTGQGAALEVLGTLIEGVHA